MARFKAHFGPGPATIQAILIDLKREHHGPINEKEVLVALNWLFCYNTEHVLAGRWGLHEETIRDKVQGLTKKLQNSNPKRSNWMLGTLMMMRSIFFLSMVCISL
jgi:hypothetical protein